MRLDRRRFLTLIVLAGAASPGRVAAQAVTLKVGIVPAEISGQILYGIDEGFFAKAGLDVQPQSFTNGGAIAAAVAGGALDVGMVDLTSLISAHAHGLPFVSLAPGLVNSREAPTFGIVVRGDSTIREAKDFNGKTIAVNGLNNIAQVSALAWLDNNGGDSKTVKFIEMPLPAKAPAVKAGTIDGSLDTEPFLTLGLDQGLRVFLMETKPLAPIYLLNVWAATKDWVQRNPETSAKFIAAMREVSVWANRNHAASAPILAKYTRLAPDVAQRMHRGEFGLANDAKLVQPVIDVAAHYGLIPKPFPAAELFPPR